MGLEGGELRVGGFHHTSSVSAEISRNARFYTEVLGLRFVYRSVNQDDVSMYHLAYGNAGASIGSVVTFFDIPRAAPNRPGRGEVASVSMRVPDLGALEWWEERFEEFGVSRGEVGERYDCRIRLDFEDGEGHRMSLVADGGEGMESGEPWTGAGVPEEYAVRGIESARMVAGSVAPTAVVLVEVLGFREAGRYEVSGGEVVVYESGVGGPGTEVHVEERPEMERARPGAGGVHHIAFRVKDDEEIALWRERVSEAGLANSGVVDRHYFRSVYFREPNGVLFELATDEPGWAADGEETLGQRLVLPPFLEDRREEIESNLKPISL